MKVKIRIEFERQADTSTNRNFNYDEVYSQIVELKIPEALVVSISNKVNEFLIREVTVPEANADPKAASGLGRSI